LRFDLTQKIKEVFDQKGIEIPFPQRVVHMVSKNQ
jgi:small-conductance mechanosensitive channel